MSSPPPVLSFKDVLLNKSFRRLWLAWLISIFGDFLAIFAVISLITYRWHGHAINVTLVSLAFVVPTAVIGPVAGVFVDRWNLKRVMIGSDLIRAFLVVLLLFVTNMPQIAVILVVLSTISSFFVPAQAVTLRLLVPPEGLLAANALMSQAIYVVRLLSPALAGVLVTAISEKSCFYLDATSFIFSAVLLSTLQITRPAGTKEKKKTLRALIGDFIAGNKFIFTHSAMAFVFTAMAVAIFVFASFSPLISIYLRDFLFAGPIWFGASSAIVGIGMIVGAQLVRRLLRIHPTTSAVLCGLAGLGMGATVLGVFQNILMAAVSTFIIGFGVAVVLVPAQTLAQQAPPPEMIGRVSSTFLSSMSLAQALGLLLSGFLAEKLGVRQLFLVCGTMAMLIAIGGYLRFREKRPVTAKGAAIG
jgi:DHA3 family macrolide efflux protein-like MFS transporter